MSSGQFYQVLGIVAPLLAGIVVDGIKTRTRIALLEEHRKDDREDIDSLERRQARHERDPVHARLRGRP